LPIAAFVEKQVPEIPISTRRGPELENFQKLVKKLGLV
jgi:hypothetical protein